MADLDPIAERHAKAERELVQALRALIRGGKHGVVSCTVQGGDPRVIKVEETKTLN